tara:strand:+ start:848 stop:1048 length:201 start_codon:yes stop_codon:yes gene_type:complete
MNEDDIYESVHNYTKFKLVEMLIEKHLDKKLKTLNSIEDVAEDVLSVLTVCGLKYHNELRNNFEDK